MLEHFGHKETAILPEDIIQHLLLGVSSLILLSRGIPPTFLALYLFILTKIEVITYNSVFVFQSTHTLELALHLESKVIKLKQDALRLMNIALAGTACGQILILCEFAFGYPQSQESKERGKQLEELECHFDAEEEPPANEDTVSKADDEKEVATQFDDGAPRAKKQCFGQCRDDLKDLVPISKAVPIVPSTSVKLSETGVPHSYYSWQEASEGQSIYKCLLKKPKTEMPCSYYLAQMAAMTTHIHHKHLKICIKCCLCQRKSYLATTISLHLKTIHKNESAEWFKPTPLLEGDMVKITDEILAENLQEIKNVSLELVEEQQDE